MNMIQIDYEHDTIDTATVKQKSLVVDTRVLECTGQNYMFDRATGHARIMTFDARTCRLSIPGYNRTSYKLRYGP